MINFSYKKAKQISLCCSSFLLLSLTPTKYGSQDVPLLKRVKEYWKEGDFALAKKQILTYLEKNPESELAEELHLLLGDLYLQEGNFLSALDEYEYVQKNDLAEKILYNKALCLYEEKKSEELFLLTDSLSSCTHLNGAQKNSIRYLTAKSLFERQNSTEIQDKDSLNKTTLLFESFQGTEFEMNSLPFLAKLYTLLEEKGKAASCYLTLANDNPNEKVSLLFAAALLFTEQEPEKALSLFQKISALNSPQKCAAIYNSLALEYQLKQFKDLVLTYENYHSIFSSEEEMKAIYLLGKSLYYLNDYQEAGKHLIESLKNTSLTISSKKTLYCMALECAYKTKNAPLYKKIWDEQIELEENNAKTHLAYIELLKSTEQKENVLEEIDTFLTKYPEHSEKENLLLSRIYALYESKKWRQAEKFLSSFLQNYPSTACFSSLLHLQLNCAAFLLQESSPEAIFVHREHWIALVQQALNTPHLLSSKEKESYSIDLIKNLFLQEKFTESLESFEEALSSFPSIESRSDLQMIRILCYLKDPDSKLLFALHAEKMIEKNSSIPEANFFRIHLFNTYLQLANESQEPGKNELLEKAAEHLFYIFAKKQQPLQKENMQWMAQYYYEKSFVNNPLALERSIVLFENLLSTSDKKENTPENYSEVNLYKLCKLLSMASLYEKKAAILDEWIYSHTSPKTHLQKHLIFELAQTHFLLGHSQRALDLYESLIRSNNSSEIGISSLFEKSKILFSNLKNEEKTDTNPLCADILSTFKDIEVLRKINSEPIHLESGLEYVYSKASLIENQSMAKEKTIELLSLFKQNFLSTPEYEQRKSQNKGQIVDAYMKFVEAEILRYEATTEESLKEALVRLQELGESSTTPDVLKKRILVSQKELSKNL